MPKKTNTPEQIIGKLRQAEVLLNQGATMAEACRKIEVTDQTFYRWRKEYGGMRVDQARRLNDLELDGEKLVGATIDEEETARVKARIAEKLARLRRRDHL